MEKRDYQETCTINDLMDKFKVSERTIRYDLEGIKGDKVNTFIDGMMKPRILLSSRNVKNGFWTMQTDSTISPEKILRRFHLMSVILQRFPLYMDVRHRKSRALQTTFLPRSI